MSGARRGCGDTGDKSPVKDWLHPRKELRLDPVETQAMPLSHRETRSDVVAWRMDWCTDEKGGEDSQLGQQWSC